jgi:hypothetical protein
MAPRQRTPVAGRSAATADEDTAVATTSSNQGLKENPKGLPVEQPTEADIARDRHDYFNLLTLVRFKIRPRRSQDGTFRFDTSRLTNLFFPL